MTLKVCDSVTQETAARSTGFCVHITSNMDLGNCAQKKCRIYTFRVITKGQLRSMHQSNIASQERSLWKAGYCGPRFHLLSREVSSMLMRVLRADPATANSRDCIWGVNSRRFSSCLAKHTIQYSKVQR